MVNLDMLPMLEQMHAEAKRHNWAHVTMSLADLGFIIQQLKSSSVKSSTDDRGTYEAFAAQYSKAFNP